FPKQAYKIKVVRLGVDPTIFRPPSPVERRRIRAKYKAQGSFALVYAGRFIPLKGIPTLIRAAELVHKRIPQTKLYLIGSGRKKYVARMKQLARRVNVPVHFVGAVRRKAMPSMYWMADCFVCPTQGHESFGLVIVEALATGVPTVASKSGGIQEII